MPIPKIIRCLPCALVTFVLFSCTNDRSFVNPVDVKTVLEPPKSVWASALADTSVSTDWIYSGPATGFEILEQIDAAQPVLVGTESPDARQHFIFAQLHTGVGYRYGVRAEADGNRSATVWSSQVNVLLNPPRSVGLQPLSDTALSIGWVYNGTFQTGFEVQRQAGPGAFVTIALEKADARSITDAVPLLLGQSYGYRVRAMSRYNVSAFTSAAMQLQPILVPGNVSNVPLADTAVSLSWSYAGTMQTGFEIQRQIGSGGFSTIALVGPAVFALVDPLNLVVGQSYVYRVRALTRYNQSAFQSAVPFSQTFDAPTNVAGQPRADTAVAITWTYVSSAGYQTGFEVQRQVGAGAFMTVASIGASARSFVDTVALTCGVSYAYRVRAVSRYNVSSFGSAAPLTLSSNGPDWVTFTTSADTLATVSWGGSVPYARMYEIQRLVSGVGYIDVGSVPSSKTVFRDTLEMLDGTMYLWRVRAVGRYNQSSYTASSLFTASLTAPYLGGPIRMSPSMVTLVWTVRSNIERGFEIQHATDTVHFSTVGMVGAGVNLADVSVSTDTTVRDWFRVRPVASVPGGFSNYLFVTYSSGVFRVGTPDTASAMERKRVSAGR